MDGDQAASAIAKEFKPKRFDIFNEENIVFHDEGEKMNKSLADDKLMVETVPGEN